MALMRAAIRPPNLHFNRWRVAQRREEAMCRQRAKQKQQLEQKVEQEQAKQHGLREILQEQTNPLPHELSTTIEFDPAAAYDGQTRPRRAGVLTLQRAESYGDRIDGTAQIVHAVTEVSYAEAHGERSEAQPLGASTPGSSEPKKPGHCIGSTRPEGTDRELVGLAAGQITNAGEPPSACASPTAHTGGSEYVHLAGLAAGQITIVKVQQIKPYI
eukprot:COSAG02_NODE_21907_length_770_cov_1.421759_1_plen_214_part_10